MDTQVRAQLDAIWGEHGRLPVPAQKGRHVGAPRV
jgi:hypothetical protein